MHIFTLYPLELAVAGMEIEAQEFIINRHVDIINIIDRGLNFHKKYLETQGVGITTTGAEIFIGAFNKYRKILFKDYLKLINKHCHEISLITDNYLPTGWSINKIFQRIGYRIRWDWQAIQDSKIQEIESLKRKIDKMYSVLEELVVMTKDTGMKKSLRLIIENAEEQLVEIRNRINTVYSTYLQRRNSLKRYRKVRVSSDSGNGNRKPRHVARRTGGNGGNVPVVAPGNQQIVTGQPVQAGPNQVGDKKPFWARAPFNRIPPGGAMAIPHYTKSLFFKIRDGFIIIREYAGEVFEIIIVIKNQIRRDVVDFKNRTLFFKSLERWEYYDPSSFWLCTISLFLCFTTLSNHLPSFYKNASQVQVVIEEVRGGGQQEVINSVVNSVKRKNFKEMLVKHFPDFESRASLEKQQARIYQKAVKKIKEYKRISPLSNNYQKCLTAEEKLSIDYFHGTGIYAKFQDSKTPPNLFDIRQTFLKKMENEDMREKFLETYNRVNPIE